MTLCKVDFTWGRPGVLLGAAFVGPGAAGMAQQADTGPRTVVSPDYLVSRDGDRSHVEIMAAANPRNLLAGAITFTRRDGGAATKAYVSRDGGGRAFLARPANPPQLCL